MNLSDIFLIDETIKNDSKISNDSRGLLAFNISLLIKDHELQVNSLFIIGSINHIVINV